MNAIKRSPEASATPRLKFDEQGHAVARTEAEHQAIAEAFQAALESMASVPDDPSISDRDCLRAIDEGRPERPLFREYY